MKNEVQIKCFVPYEMGFSTRDSISIHLYHVFKVFYVVSFIHDVNLLFFEQPKCISTFQHPVLFRVEKKKTKTTRRKRTTKMEIGNVTNKKNLNYFIDLQVTTCICKFKNNKKGNKNHLKLAFLENLLT